MSNNKMGDMVTIQRDALGQYFPLQLKITHIGEHTMDTFDDIYDEDTQELEGMRNAKGKMKTKDFARLINKRALSRYELDEIFM